MKLQKASVRLTRGATYSGYRLTLYMGLNSDSGPSSPKLLESQNDLYKYFNTFDGDQSFKTANFCLGLGYRVYAQRVNTILGRASCRKFIINDDNSRELFYSPLKEYYDTLNFNFIEPQQVEGKDQNAIDNSLYSAVLTLIRPSIQIQDNSAISDNFMMIVPRTIYDPVKDGYEVIYERLVGIGWEDNPDLALYSSTPGHTYQLDTLYYKDFKSTIINFLENKCSLEVTEITDDTIYVQSQSPIQGFQIINDYVSDDQAKASILKFLSSDIGLQDNYCRKYDNYKVCSIYTKDEDSLDDVEVVITESLGSYLVDVYRYNSENIVIYSESFSYSTSPETSNFITNLSTDSDIVEIDVHDPSANLQGTYRLMGTERIETPTMYTDSVLDGDLYSDIVVDNSTSDQLNYIKGLKNTYNLSILFTGYDFEDLESPDLFVRTCIVCPEVTWRATGDTLKGFTYLLYLLPSYNSGSDYSVLRRSNLPETYTQNCLIIDKSDYSIELMGSNVALKTLNSKFPIRPAISVIAVLNYMLHLSCKTEQEFQSYLGKVTSEVNKYLGTSTMVMIERVNILDHRLSATLNFYVDKQIILSYRVSANLVV